MKNYTKSTLFKTLGSAALFSIASFAQETGDFRVIKPEVSLLKAPLSPQQMPDTDQSVLFGRSVFQAPEAGLGKPLADYLPAEGGGFRIINGKRKMNRPISPGMNRVNTGDLPVFTLFTDTGSGYARVPGGERVYPLWPRPDAQTGGMAELGTLRMGVPGPDGKPVWFDAMPELQMVTTFRPGYSDYQLKTAAWNASIRVVPAQGFNGMICRVEFDKPVSLVWQYGKIFFPRTKSVKNSVAIDGSVARITDPSLPNGLVLAGWDGAGAGSVLSTANGQEAEFVSGPPQRIYHIYAVWGVTNYDKKLADDMMSRLDNPATASWSQETRDRLKKKWFDCMIGPALEPDKHFRQTAENPGKEFDRAIGWWDARRAEFQIETPDPELDSLINWARCTSEYHRRGPGLTLGSNGWDGLGHISVGWYGKQWAGDQQDVADCMRIYGALQKTDGQLGWVTLALLSYAGENLNPSWVEHVWRHYSWTGDREFVRDLWPLVQKAIQWQRTREDPDGDGLCRGSTAEYWNCEFANGKGPKAATPSIMLWNMLNCAEKMAKVVGDTDAQAEYRALAEKTRTAIFKELWNEEAGRIGSVGEDGLWMGHPQIWDEFFGVHTGLLDASQGRRAMRWIESHYGIEPQPGVNLLFTSDAWPLVWSIQWCASGDTMLAALAGMKCGDGDLWWPYVKTAVSSAFRTDRPAIRLGISNYGVAGGGFEYIDSVDPYVYATVRGLFGIEPAVQDGRIDICPAFPSTWTNASIRTPDIRYEYRRNGNQATFHITTAKPLVKRVRANLSGAVVETKAECESTVVVELGPQPPAPEPPPRPTILAEQNPVPAPRVLTDAERRKQVLFDLAAACNVTTEELVTTKFIYDVGWNKSVAGQPRGADMIMPPSPRVIDLPTGVRFLTAGRPEKSGAPVPKNMLGVASWKPYPWPGGAVISVGMRCKSLQLLLQSYIHPHKHYMPNGEVVLNYADGTRHIESLVAPYNLDCYFQHYSRQGVAVPFGELLGEAHRHAFTPEMHADALEIICDPSRVLESVELRAITSETFIALAALTALPAEE